MLHRYDCIDSLTKAGIEYSDAVALRRIAMTLHRWHELECGDSNDYCSRALVRGIRRRETLAGGSKVWTFEYAEDGDNAGKPHIETHYHRGDAKPSYYPVPDRERGALKRLAAIMARYPGFASYVQGDPRGASLYILHPNAIAGADAFSTEPAKRAEWLACNYSRGIAVCQ